MRKVDILPGLRASFLLIAYKQEATVAEAVRAALAQQSEPLDIIISDDCSPDGTFLAMHGAASGYSGPHRVRLRQSPARMGIVAHLEALAAEATGELLVLAAGDDISEISRTEKILQRWDQLGNPIAAIYSDFTPLDASGNPVRSNEGPHPGPHSLNSLARGPEGMLGATFAYTRDVFFPPLSARVTREDRVYPFRALLKNGRISYIDEKLVRYRVEGGISRNLPPTRRDYITWFSRQLFAQTVEDARQRSSDALLLRPLDIALHRICRATIAEQEAKLAMSDGLALERKAFTAICHGAPALRMLKHYAKFRLPA
jgi:glycosyltransferase involved in cell wall biosynthesis